MIFTLRPPDAAGPLLIGAAGPDTVNILQRLGEPHLFCRTRDSHPAWAVQRPSGLFVSVYFDRDDRAHAVEFGCPHDTGDTVVYDGLDVFATAAADLVELLRAHTTVYDEEDEHVFTAPKLLLSFWRPITPEGPDDEDGRFFDSVLLARPGYYNHAAK